MGPPQAPQNKPSAGLIVALILLAVAAVGAGGFFLLSGDDDDETADPPVATTQPGSGPVTTLPGDPGEIVVPDPPGAPGEPEVSIEEAAASASAPDLPPSGEAQFDEVADDCYNGSMQACDDLYAQAPAGSEYQAYGDTCAARVSDSHGYYCTDLLPDPIPPSD